MRGQGQASRSLQGAGAICCAALQAHSRAQLTLPASCRIKKGIHLGQGREFSLMLTQHTLSCFPLGAEKTPFASLDLASDAVLSVGGKQSFTIRDQTHASYHFFFPAAAEKLKWMAAFQQVGGLHRRALLGAPVAPQRPGCEDSHCMRSAPGFIASMCSTQSCRPSRPSRCTSRAGLASGAHCERTCAALPLHHLGLARPCATRCR